MGAYLHRTAVNAALDLLRARRDSQFSTLEDAGELQSKNPSLSPDRMQHASETRELLRKALARLHPRTAEMFVLRYIEDYDNREIAKVMKTSQAVVAVTLHRTRARLKKDLRGLMRGRV
jgi:RNA polymerase sigma-70 factor (ECF subfamily)